MLEKKDESHIGGGSAFMLIAFALVIDGIQVLLTIFLVGFIVNPFISICAAMIFGIWLSHLGVNMLSAKYVVRFLGTSIGEFAFGMFPFWTFMIALTVVANKVKEAIEPSGGNKRGWRL